MIADTSTSDTIFITTLIGACGTLSGAVVFLFKMLIKEKDARIASLEDVRKSAKHSRKEDNE